MVLGAELCAAGLRLRHGGGTASALRSMASPSWRSGAQIRIASPIGCAPSMPFRWRAGSLASAMPASRGCDWYAGVVQPRAIRLVRNGLCAVWARGRSGGGQPPGHAAGGHALGQRIDFRIQKQPPWVPSPEIRSWRSHRAAKMRCRCG